MHNQAIVKLKYLKTLTNVKTQLDEYVGDVDEFIVQDLSENKEFCKLVRGDNIYSLSMNTLVPTALLTLIKDSMENFVVKCIPKFHSDLIYSFSLECESMKEMWESVLTEEKLTRFTTKPEEENYVPKESYDYFGLNIHNFYIELENYNLYLFKKEDLKSLI